MNTTKNLLIIGISVFLFTACQGMMGGGDSNKRGAAALSTSTDPCVNVNLDEGCTCDSSTGKVMISCSDGKPCTHVSMPSTACTCDKTSGEVTCPEFTSTDTATGTAGSSSSSPTTSSNTTVAGGLPNGSTCSVDNQCLNNICNKFNNQCASAGGAGAVCLRNMECSSQFCAPNNSCCASSACGSSCCGSGQKCCGGAVCTPNATPCGKG